MTRLLAIKVAPNVERKIRRVLLSEAFPHPGITSGIGSSFDLERLAYAQIRDALASLGASIAHVCSKQLWRDFRHGHGRAASPHRRRRGPVDRCKHRRCPARGDKSARII